MKSNASLVYNLFLVIGDFLSLVLAFVGAYVLRVTFGLTFGATSVAHPVEAATYLRIFLLVTPFWIIIFGLLGLYNSTIYTKRFSEAGRLFIGSFIGLLFVTSYAYASNQIIFPGKLVPVYGFILAYLFLLLFRNIARFIRTRLFHYDIGITNILLIGNTVVAAELIESLQPSQQTGYRIVGVVGSQHNVPRNAHLKVFHSFKEACQAIGTEDIHSIVQTELYTTPEKNDEILGFAQKNHISFRFIPGNTELFVGNISVELFRSSIPVIAVHQTPLLGWGRIVKRLFDLTLGSLMLIVVSPIMVLVALLVKLTSIGPVFFRQERLTRFNNRFRVFKFRTQYRKFGKGTPEDDFELIGKPELAKKFRENGNYLADDPRITPVGRFLRRTSLDELPQLFNVIKGDISLVGPRALIPQDLDVYAKRHTILSVKSGLTGLAQVSGRNNISFDERRQLDMYYVQNWSFWQDIVILLKTIRVVLQGS
ncbi:MAG TPA: sugar transferase [Patescibacteria group bacterium]|nr:sugar transferase [Patescibacteria group bacterium]